MKKASPIVTLTFPFVAGVAAAALISRPFWTALAASAAAAGLFAAGLSRSLRVPVPLFAALGALCWSTAALGGGPPPRPGALQGAMDALQAAIDGAGFPGAHSAAIVTALLTGRKGLLPRETVRAFRDAGASHILALSGLHLGIIYAVLKRLLSPLGNSPGASTLRSIVTVTVCALYALATGAGPSIIRAFLFILIGETARSVRHRSLSPDGTFCLALTVQLAAAPQLVASPGFQLSYLAMLGIITLFPPLRDCYPSSRKPAPLRRVWTAAALTLSCQIFTAPAAWWHFHTFPRHFLLANIIALPLVEAVIITALATLLLQAAGICPPVLVKACGSMVQLMEFCLDTIASM